MIIESILIVSIAIFFDFTFGDPKNRYHPTSWIGGLIAKLTPIAKNKNHVIEKLGGILVVTITSSIVILLLLMGYNLKLCHKLLQTILHF